MAEPDPDIFDEVEDEAEPILRALKPEAVS